MRRTIRLALLVAALAGCGASTSPWSVRAVFSATTHPFPANPRQIDEEARMVVNVTAGPGFAARMAACQLLI
jgi:hypothetical protein